MRNCPDLTVDCVISNGDSIVLIKRGKHPFFGLYALPGGYVEIGETVEDACRREVMEETGLTIYDLRLIGVYSNPQRDPRKHTVSVAFFAYSSMKNMQAGDDASSVELVKNWKNIELAFDHSKILKNAEKFFH